MNKQKIRWNRTDFALLLIGLIPVAASLFIYSKLPEQMAVHFNLSGEPDGYQGKTSFLILIGLLVIGTPILIKVTKYIDPKQENYEKFSRVYEIFRAAITVFLSVIFGIVLLYNIGIYISAQLVVMLGLGLLFVLIGNYMGRIRLNYFIGIRTPWTLSNETVWRRTHRLAGPIWAIAGVVTLICAFLPGMLAFIIFGITLGIAILYPTVYSYLLYRKLKK